MELTFKEFLRGGKEQLSAAGFADVEAEILLAHTLGISRMDLHNPLTVENALSAIGDSRQSSGLVAGAEKPRFGST